MEKHRALLFILKDERLEEYIKVKDKYYNQLNEIGLTNEEN